DSVVLADGVEAIGEGAFYECKYLSEVELPAGLKEIGAKAFYKCESLSAVAVPDTVTEIGAEAFRYCSVLESVNIPEGVTAVKENTFEDCFKLASIELPDSVVEIGDYAFDECSALKNISVSKDLASIGDYAFRQCSSLEQITLANAVLSIGEGAFAYCGALTEFTFPARITEIKPYTFEECGALTELTVPDGVTAVGDYAFAWCGSVTEILLPDSLKTIGANAFYRCTHLKSITIPCNVTSIGAGAFWSCTNLDVVGFNGNAPEFIGSNHFYKVAADVYVNSTWTEDDMQQFGGSLKYIVGMPQRPFITATPADSSVKLSWESVSNALYYKVYLYADDTFSEIAETQDTEYTVTGLTNGTEYGFAVEAVNPVGSAGKSADAVVYATPEMPGVISVEIESPPTKTAYYPYEQLDLTGAALKVYYADGTEGVIDITESMTQGFSTAVGTHTITVTYGGHSDAFTVTVTEPVLRNLVLKKKPNVLLYYIGESLSLLGSELEFVYDNGSQTGPIEFSMVSGFDSETAGEKTIVVTYGGKQVRFTVTVVAASF
ncbi:MAG: leucine-rich repeat protein, partial [Oscillospiraceae bacterium]